MGQIKERKNTLISLSVVCFLLSTGVSFGQLHSPNQPQNTPLVLAEEQYQHGNYELAKQFAGRDLKQQKNSISAAEGDNIDRASYYITRCNLKMDLPGSADSAVALFKTTSNPAYKQRTAQAMAQYYF